MVRLLLFAGAWKPGPEGRGESRSSRGLGVLCALCVAVGRGGGGTFVFVCFFGRGGGGLVVVHSLSKSFSGVKL